MDTHELRVFLRDRISNACGDPMGLEAAVDEIMGRWQRDVDAADRAGYDRGFDEGVDEGREQML